MLLRHVRKNDVTTSAVLTVSIAALLGWLQPSTANAAEIHVKHVTITLVRQSSIPAREAGLLTKINVTEGQSVTATDVVAVLQNEHQKLALTAAEFNSKVASIHAENMLAVDTATAQLRESQSARRVKEVALEIAKQQADSEVPIKVAVAETKMRQLELERASKARKSFKGSISESEIDRLRTAVEKGQLEIQQAKNDYAIHQLKPEAEQAAMNQKDEEVLRHQSLIAQERKNVEVAKVNQLIRENEVALAKLNLEQRNVRAPFRGTVVKVEAQVGEWVEPGAAVVRIIDLKTLRAEGFLPAAQASDELTGRKVLIIVRNSGQAIQLPGTVTFVSPEVDPVNQQVRFWAEFDNSKATVRPGMNAALTITE